MKRKDLSVGMTVAVVSSKYGPPGKGVVLDVGRWIKKPYYMVSEYIQKTVAHEGAEYTIESTSKPASQYDTGSGVLIGYKVEFGDKREPGFTARTTPLNQIVSEWEPYIADYNAAQERQRQRQRKQEQSDRAAHHRGEIRAALAGMGIDPDDPGVTIHHSGETVTLARRLLP